MEMFRVHLYIFFQISRASVKDENSIVFSSKRFSKKKKKIKKGIDEATGLIFTLC